VYVEDGEIEIVNPFTGERHYSSTIGPAQFMGEISLLYGGTASLPLRTVVDTRVIEVPREAFLTLMSQIPEMSDIIITVFAARRRRQLDERRSGLYLIGEETDRNVRRIAEFASRNRLPYTSVPLHSPEAETSAKSCAIDARTPAVIFGSKVPITDATPDKIARLLGLNIDFSGDERFDVLIVGGGPAGVAAAVYAGAEGLRAPVVEEGFTRLLGEPMAIERHRATGEQPIDHVGHIECRQLWRRHLKLVPDVPEHRSWDVIQAIQGRSGHPNESQL
jgi:thioredoxin reductase (NADPH)